MIYILVRKKEVRTTDQHASIIHLHTMRLDGQIGEGLHRFLNLLKLTGHVTHQEFNVQ